MKTLVLCGLPKNLKSAFLCFALASGAFAQAFGAEQANAQDRNSPPSSKNDMEKKAVRQETIVLYDKNAYLAATVQGRKDAEADFKEKKYRFMTYGLRSAIPSKYELYLEKHYGIAFEPAAGCTVQSAEQGRADGYNARMKTLLVKLHKKDIFKEAENYARTDKTNPLESLQ